jgi:hypothetical protein
MKNPFSKKMTDEQFQASMRRYEAFFKGETADRPPVNFTFWKENKNSVRPARKQYASLKEQWMDVEQRAAEANYYFDNAEFYSDAMPTYMPNLGPEIFSAICGCEYFFGPDTTWTEPCITDWEKDADKAVMNRNSEYFAAVDKFTRELLKYSKDKFAVGFTDFHAGADHLAALRDPENLCTDLYDYPEFVRAKLKSSYIEYYKFYEYFYSLITFEGEPTTSWIGLIADGRYNVVQNDFSCMISQQMFDEFFMEGLIDECNHLDRNIYHLDGPDALKHLDRLLEIKNLQAVQWVCGAGNEGFNRWISVYQKIQKAKRGVLLGIDIKELGDVFANLKPDGIWFQYISGVNTKEEADKIIERIKNWK